MINDLNEISIESSEGRLLMAALAKITSESQTDKTPNEVIGQLNLLADKMFTKEQEFSKHPSVISENENELLFDKEGNLIKELPKQDVDKLGNEDVPKLGYDVEKFATEWIDKNSHKWSNNTDEVGDNYGSFIEGYNKAKEKYEFTREQMQEIIKNVRSVYNKKIETLYTEEQVREAISKSVSILVGQEINLAQLKELTIQSLKQPKKD